MNKIKQRGFLYSLSGVLCICVFTAIYCIADGQSMAASHIEPQYGIAGLQIIAAVILAVFLLIAKAYKRAKRKWFLLPLILVSFAPMYIFIVSQYDCCYGG